MEDQYINKDWHMDIERFAQLPQKLKLARLIRKLKDEHNVSFEEADWIYSVSKEPYLTPILQYWYAVAADKIERRYGGDFIFAIPYIFRTFSFSKKSEFPYFSFKGPEYLKVVTRALTKYGKPEDRVYAIRTNAQGFSLFPKHLQNLFEILKDETHMKYVLWIRRAGLLRYPLRDPKSGKVYTILQFLKEKLPAPIIKTSNELDIDIGTTEFSPFGLDYLRMHVPIIEVRQRCNIEGADGEAAVFTNEKSLAIAKELLSVPFPDIIRYAVYNGFINTRTADYYLKGNMATACGYYFEKFYAEAGRKYIEEKAKEFKIKTRMKKEQKVARNIVEDEDVWLEEIR